MSKNYSVYLNSRKIGTTKLEKADAPMGVAFGLIDFEEIINSPYDFFKEYCSKNEVIINIDEPQHKFIATQVIPGLKVLREDGFEIKGVSGNAIDGMEEEGYEISIFGISYPFYEEEFPHHVKEYKDMFNK